METDKQDDPEVVTVEPQDLVRVQVCFRKSGVPGAQDPHGAIKFEVMQPRACLKHWEGLRQFKTPGSPNVNIVFEGKCIRPPVSGSLALGEDGESSSTVVHDADLESLQQRREGLRIDIARLEAAAGQLTEQHIRLRKQYAEEEQRLQSNLAQQAELLKKQREHQAAEDGLVHDRITHLLEVERGVSETLKHRINKYNEDLTGAVNREADVQNQIEALVAAAKAKGEGSTFDRTLDRLERGAGRLFSSEIGLDFLRKVVSKL